MFLKKLPENINNKGWKIFLALVLLFAWGTILLGTYSFIS